MPTRAYDVWVVDAQGNRVRQPVTEEVPAAEANGATLQTRAMAALDANITFLAIAAPTNAQTLAQVRVLTKECSALIRLMLNQLDSTDGA